MGKQAAVTVCIAVLAGVTGVGLAAQAVDRPEIPSVRARTVPPGVATVKGRVTDQVTGLPIANALMRVVAPASDMGKVRAGQMPTMFAETRTDASGQYLMHVRFAPGVKAYAIDALHPGHETLGPYGRAFDAYMKLNGQDSLELQKFCRSHH